jgi:hypothetical protein
MNPEEIRERIRISMDATLKEAKPEINTDPHLMHLLTEMSYIMHRIGMKDAFRQMRATLSTLEDELTK